MKIKTGEYDVVYSGTVIAIESEPFELIFSEENESLRIIIDFKEDPKIEGTPIEFNVVNPKTLELVMINTDSHTEFGNTKLLNLGYLNNRKLYLNYRINSLKKLSKTLHYTFYLGEEVSDVK